MAIVTLCPQCQTAFAIHAEHYSAADAWVRCGRCAHVFEVDQHLFELDDPPPAPASLPTVLQTEQVRPRPQVTPSNNLLNAGMWNLMALLLALLLGFQFLLHQRHHLRGINPELSPALTSMCQTLSCELDWPMQPDKLSIESGSFKHLGGNDYAFEGVIKNRSAVSMRAPSLELSLTDDIDMPVVRKVIAPEDMGFASPLRGYRAQSFEVTFTLEPPISSNVNGYRAFLFYP